MEVTVELYATIRDAVGRKRVAQTVEPDATVRDLLRAIAEEYDGVGPLVFDSEERVRSNVNVLVNEAPIRSRSGLETALADGDTVMVAPSVAGG